MGKQSHYDVLGVSENATLPEITRAYRTKALKHHPDRNHGLDPKSAADEFIRINEAFATLSDEARKTKYDNAQRVKHFGDEPQENVEISGYLTHPKKPISDVFKGLYKKYHAEFIAKPVKRKEKSSSEYQTPELFHALRDYAENAVSPEPILFSGSPTPELAVSLFRQFLNREYYGVNLSALKSHFQSAVIKAEISKTNTATIHLYQSMLDIISMVQESESEHKLFASIQHILNFGKESVAHNDASVMMYLEPLVQSFAFRDLIDSALPQSWETIDKRTLTVQLQSQFTSKLDQKVSEDDEGNMGVYFHRLLGFQKKMKKAFNRELSASQLRELAYLCLDYMPFLAGSSAVTHNLFLQAAFLFQKASELETDHTAQMSDEQMAIQLCLQASIQARKDAPFVDIPVHQTTLRIFNQLRYVHPHVLVLQPEIESHVRKKAKVLPCFESLSSPLDVMLNSEVNDKFGQKIFDSLIMCIEHNINIDYTRDDIYHEAFESSLSWYKPENPKKLRLDAMQAYLQTKGWTFDDMALNLHSNGLMVRIDDEKYIDWGKPAVYPKGTKTYQSIDGIEIDSKLGKVTLVLKPFKAGDPPHKEAITDCDVLELIDREIDGVYFSLDQEDPERQHDPFQKIVYGPETLYQTGLLTALFHADYFLKFLTTGCEVQADYPFDIRSMDKKLEGLPAHLKNIITTFQNAPSSDDTHRFWIEASVVPTLKEEIESEEKIRYTLGDIQMTVKKHRMKLNARGEAVDTNDDNEGYSIYKFDKSKFEKTKLNLSALQSPAIINIHNTDEYYFYEDGVLSVKPEKITISDILKKIYNVQKFDENGLLVRTKMNKKDKTDDNMDFIYEFTLAITQAAGRDPHFSKEEIFAREFTKHYDEFAQYFPIFERLRQLAKVTCVVGLMAQQRARNNLNLAHLEAQLNDGAHWTQREAEIKAKITASQSTRLTQAKAGVTNSYQTILAGQTTHLQGVLNQINSQPPIPQVNANSPEIVNRCNEIYNEIFQDLVNKRGQAVAHAQAHRIRPEAINSNIPGMVQNLNNQINAANAARTANYKQQMLTVHPAHHAHIDQFMAGNVHPLAQAVAAKEHAEHVQSFNQQLYTTFAGYPATDIAAFINGNPQPLAASIAARQAGEHIIEAKAHLRGVIQEMHALEKAFVEWSLSASAKQKFDLKNECNLVPASFASDTRHRVYGGVTFMPNSNTKLQAEAAIRSLSLPTTSAFSTNTTHNISNAKSLLSNIQSSAASVPVPFRANMQPVEMMMFNLQSAIRHAETENAFAKSRQQHEEWMNKIKNSFTGVAVPSKPVPPPPTVSRPVYTPPPAKMDSPKTGIIKAAAIAAGISLAASGAEGSNRKHDLSDLLMETPLNDHRPSVYRDQATQYKHENSVNEPQRNDEPAHKVDHAALGFSNRSLEDGSLTLAEVLQGKVSSAGYMTYREDSIHCALAKDAFNRALDDSDQDNFLGTAEAEVRALNFALSKLRRTSNVTELENAVHAHCKPPTERVLNMHKNDRELLGTPLNTQMKDLPSATTRQLYNLYDYFGKDTSTEPTKELHQPDKPQHPKK